MPPKITQNRQTGAKIGDPQLCTENSELLKRFCTAKTQVGHKGERIANGFVAGELLF